MHFCSFCTCLIPCWQLTTSRRRMSSSVTSWATRSRSAIGMALHGRPSTCSSQIFELYTLSAAEHVLSDASLQGLGQKLTRLS